MTGDSIDIWMKREHTLKYLDHCKQINKEVKESGKLLLNARINKRFPTSAKIGP